MGRTDAVLMTHLSVRFQVGAPWRKATALRVLHLPSSRHQWSEKFSLPRPPLTQLRPTRPHVCKLLVNPRATTDCVPEHFVTFFLSLETRIRPNLISSWERCCATRLANYNRVINKSFDLGGLWL